MVERGSFDAWGKRRFPNGSDDPNDTITSLNPRGFTFQEHLDNVGLVHMNGRVYDPLLGRFTSADPFVQFPDSTQGFNRYACANNNPLSYTDPSGYDDMPPGIGGFDPGLYINIIGGTPEPSPYPGSEYPDPGAGAFPPSLGIYYPGKGAPGPGSIIGGNLKTAIPGNLYGWTGSMDLSQFGPVSNNMAAASSSLWAMPGSSFSNATHLGLGTASLIPGLGSFFSGLDAAYYAMQGDYKGASLAAFGMIPFVGAFGHITEVGNGLAEALNVGSEAVNAAKTAGQLGKEGESAVRSVYDIGDKTKIAINGRTWIPDGLIPGESLSEVKNVNSLSFTRQLRDYSEYAQREGLRFDLYTRPNTGLSGPLQDAIRNGTINRLDIPQ